MTVSILLMKQIFSLLLMMACGYVLVKTGLLKAEESHTVAVMTLYVIMPCVIVNAFRISYTEEIRSNFLLAVGAAVFIHILMISATAMLKKPLKLTAVEQASMIYPNAANLIVPLVGAVLGEEWVIYSSAYICVQTLCIWTHGQKILFGSKSKISIKKILLNPNLLAAFLGILIFFFHIPLPQLLDETMTGISKAVGPISMMMIGMLLSTYRFREIFENRHMVLTLLMRMLVFPLAVLFLFKYSGAARLAPDGQKVLLVSLLAVSAPTAITITQMAQVGGEDARYAGLINAASTLVCIVTMPLMVYLYMG